jgi:hypothetical protein
VLSSPPPRPGRPLGTSSDSARIVAGEMAAPPREGKSRRGVVCKVAANDPVEAEVSADHRVAVEMDD